MCSSILWHKLHKQLIHIAALLSSVEGSPILNHDGSEPTDEEETLGPSDSFMNDWTAELLSLDSEDDNVMQGIGNEIEIERQVLTEWILHFLF